MTDLRQALAQPVQESAKLDCSAPFVMTPHRVFAKPPKREWVGLTDDDIGVWPVWSPEIDEFVRTIEAKLKEKNT